MGMSIFTKRVRLVLLFLTIFLPLIVSCEKPPEKKSSPTSIKKIAFLQPADHPILNSVADGFSSKINNMLGDNVELSMRNAGGDKDYLRQEAARLTSSEYDVVVPITTPATLAVIGASNGNIPIVFTFVTEPKALGYSGEGSIPKLTGLSNATGFDGTLDAIKTLLPDAKNVGYIVSAEPNALYIQKTFAEKMRKRNLEQKVVNIINAQEIPQAARSLASNVDCFLVGGDHVLVSNIDVLLDVAALFNKPVFAVDEGSVKKGAIAASTINYYKLGEATADYVAYILSGADPEKLPVKKYSDFELIINEQACNKYSIVIPNHLRMQARVINP